MREIYHACASIVHKTMRHTEFVKQLMSLVWHLEMQRHVYPVPFFFKQHLRGILLLCT